MTKTGTAYFKSMSRAAHYFAEQGDEDAAVTVANKLRDGEIHIGRPPLLPGQALVLIDNGTRWAIIEED